MNTFNVDYAGNLQEFSQRNTFPDWVEREKFYNCEDFSQNFIKRGTLSGISFWKKLVHLQ